MPDIIQFLGDEEAVFDPAVIKAMSMALDDVCKALKVDGNSHLLEEVAVLIIALARTGEHSPTKLRDHVLNLMDGLTGL